MTTPRAPGVYPAPEERRYVPISLGPSGIPGFVGLAERGPTNAPVRITTLDQFTEVYGTLATDSFLEAAVTGFFLNGGQACFVLRVAHTLRRRREEVARAAFLRLEDGEGKPTMVVRAANEGVWGNKIRIRLKRQEPRVSTFLTLDLKAGDSSAVIKSTLGLSRGTVVRIRDYAKSTYRVLTELSGKTIAWDPAWPLEDDYKSGAPTYVEPVEFSLESQLGLERERFKNLSTDPSSDQYFERVINERSRFLAVQDLQSETPLPENYPVDVDETNLSQGSDGLFTVTPEDFIGANIGPEERFGLAAYEAIEEVDLLLAPDLVWALERSAGFRTEKDVEVVQDAMISQCERLKDRFAILDFPDSSDHRRAGQWRLLYDTSYAAFYFPWLRIEDRNGKRLVPPSGHVAGIYARCDKSEGSFRAPANEVIDGVIDLGRTLNETDIGLLNDMGINCIKPLPRRGIRVWGARTTANDPQWRYINVRRVMSHIITSVERGLQWAVFESNSPFLWKSLSRQVTGFLTELFKEGYFAGRSPEESFFVKCDEETNPPENRVRGQVTVECGVAPVRPAEYLIFRVAADLEQREPEE